MTKTATTTRELASELRNNLQLVIATSRGGGKSMGFLHINTGKLMVQDEFYGFMEYTKGEVESEFTIQKVDNKYFNL